MAFNPDKHTFPYKKYVTTLIHKDFEYDVSALPSPVDNISVINLPNWLEALNIFYDAANDKILFQLRLKVSVILGMAEGSYTVLPKLRFRVGGLSTGTTEALPITLELQDTVQLALSPTIMTFNYVLGDPIPQTKLLQITAESNWSLIKQESWMTTNTNSGIGDSSVFVGVDPTGLAVGNYTGGIIEVTDSFGIKRNLTINLYITGQDTEVDYLYVSPQNFSFISEQGVANATIKNLLLESSGNWTTVISETWLQLSVTSGGSGNTNLEVSVDSVLLAIGSYSAEITFTQGDIIKKVYVTLKVIAYAISGVESENTYYALDRNKVSVAQAVENTFLQLEMVASNSDDNFLYKKEAPYFKGFANILIGTETENLQLKATPSNTLISGISNRLTPVNYGFQALNINKTTNSISNVKTFQNLWFLRGETPTVTDKLCYVPDSITVTNKAIISLTLRADVAPTEIDITGDVTATISTSIADGLYVYNALVNLADYTLVSGNTITITFGSLVVNLTIKANEAEQNQIAFENEWGEFEYVEFTGQLVKASDADKTTQQLAIEGTKHTKVVSIDIGEEYSINTGWIYSQEEVDWLGRILKAHRIYIYEGTTPIEVELTTKKMELYRTREYLKDYTLKFKKAII